MNKKKKMLSEYQRTADGLYGTDVAERPAQYK